MSREVNFLRERRKQLSKVEQQDRRILRLSTYVLIFVSVIMILVFGIFGVFQFQFNQVKAAQQEARGQITSNQATERTFVVFSHKLTNLSRILQNRKEKKEAINFFTNLFGPTIFITQIEYDQKDQLLIFKVQSKDVFVLKEVFNTLQSPAVKEAFPSVNPSDLSRGSDGIYEMSIAVVTEQKQ